MSPPAKARSLDDSEECVDRRVSAGTKALNASGRFIAKHGLATFIVVVVLGTGIYGGWHFFGWVGVRVDKWVDPLVADSIKSLRDGRELNAKLAVESVAQTQAMGAMTDAIERLLQNQTEIKENGSKQRVVIESQAEDIAEMNKSIRELVETVKKKPDGMMN